MNTWSLYKGNGVDKHRIHLPPAPDWRDFKGEPINIDEILTEEDDYSKRLLARGEMFQVEENEVHLVNAALCLRRPLLVSGKPGCGKTSLAYSVARELELGPVLRWSITSSTKLVDGLYSYDAIGRLQGVSMDESPLDIGKYIRLGPLGAALLPTKKPRVLLIDEIDKSDIDLPNDLLHIFEEGEFEIPELVRLSEKQSMVDIYYGKKNTVTVPIEAGHIRCREFPFVVLTSNGEREFPPAFKRRCLRLKMEIPEKDKLEKIVTAHLGPKVLPVANDLIDLFLERGKQGELATDQLLNAVYLVSSGADTRSKAEIIEDVFQYLSN